MPRARDTEAEKRKERERLGQKNWKQSLKKSGQWHGKNERSQDEK